MDVECWTEPNKEMKGLSLLLAGPIDTENCCRTFGCWR